MNRADLGHACFLNALDGANPQVKVGIHGIFYQNRHIHAAQGVGDFLHGKRIDSRAGAYPEHIHPVFQGFIDLISIGDFDGGAQAGHPDYLKAILRFKSNMDSGQFLPVQQAVVQALRLPNDWYSNLNKIYRERQKASFSILKSLDCQYDNRQQGMFVWAKIPDRYRDGYELSDELLYEKNVFLTPGGIFGSNGERFVRISLCSPVEVLNEAIERIAAPRTRITDNQQLITTP